MPKQVKDAFLTYDGEQPQLVVEFEDECVAQDIAQDEYDVWKEYLKEEKRDV